MDNIQKIIIELLVRNGINDPDLNKIQELITEEKELNLQLIDKENDVSELKNELVYAQLSNRVIESFIKAYMNGEITEAELNDFSKHIKDFLSKEIDLNKLSEMANILS